MIKIEARVEVKPTESEEKVLQALNNVLEYEKMEIIEEGDKKFIVAKASSHAALFKLANLIRKQRIELSARSILEKSVQINGLTFRLNKQAAYMNRVSFVTIEGEAPLGYIEIRIITDDINRVLDQLAPKVEIKRTKAEGGRSLEQG